MITFIARQIEKNAQVSLEKGIETYQAYFVNTAIYTRYKADVDTILRTDGFADVIVE